MRWAICSPPANAWRPRRCARAALGAALYVVAQSYLQDLLQLGSTAAAGLPWLAALLSPDRWLLWLGLLFVLSVYYFPTGVVGRLRLSAIKA